jgi:hypothetical protein
MVCLLASQCVIRSQTFSRRAQFQPATDLQTSDV